MRQEFRLLPIGTISTPFPVLAATPIQPSPRAGGALETVEVFAAETDAANLQERQQQTDERNRSPAVTGQR
jgi:hypothetical protein